MAAADAKRQRVFDFSVWDDDRFKDLRADILNFVILPDRAPETPTLLGETKRLLDKMEVLVGTWAHPPNTNPIFVTLRGWVVFGFTRVGHSVGLHDGQVRRAVRYE